MAKGNGGRNLTALLYVVLGFAAGAGFALVVVFYLGYGRRPLHEEGAAVEERALPRISEPRPPLTPPIMHEVSRGGLPRVAIVIDDMGRDLKALSEFLEIDAPITFAVLPRLSHSRDVAEAAHSRGHEVLLHLPMEPKPSADGQKDPGQGALLTTMSSADVKSMVEDDLKEVPHASGINNHMGSKFTEDEALMRAVMGVVKDKGLFFLDSLTTPASVGSRLARELGVRGAKRSIFLDNTRDGAYIKAQIDGLASSARKRGKAVAIGHPYPETIAALKDALPGLKESGVEVVGLSEMVE